MRLHAELRRKQSEIQDENCIVTDIIELPESEYASLYQNLLRERDYLAERANMESFIDGQRCCVLVLGEGQEDGILVDSQGSSYARRSAFIPEARTLVRNHIFRRLSQRGITIIMITHEPSIAQCADKTYHILDGRLYTNGIVQSTAKEAVHEEI